MQGFFAGFYAIANLAGSFICHQLPDRSFHLAGVQLPVCARCTGIYGGALLGFLLWGGWKVTIRLREDASASRGVSPRRPTPRRIAAILGIAAAPTLITLATGTLGIWDPSNSGRAIAGLPLGLVAGAMLGAMASKDLR